MKTPKPQGIHSQIPTPPEVAKSVGNKKKIEVVILIIEKAIAKDPKGPRARRRCCWYPN
jgi:hypothetical protein